MHPSSDASTAPLRFASEADGSVRAALARSPGAVAAAVAVAAVWAVGVALVPLGNRGIVGLPRGVPVNMWLPVGDLVFIAVVLAWGRQQHNRRVWAPVLGVLLCDLAANVSWLVAYISQGQAPDGFTIGDAFWLMSYPFLFAAVLQVFHARDAGRPLPRVVAFDVLLVVGAVAVFAYEWIVVPVRENADVGASLLATVIAYPVLDTGLLVLVALVAFRRSWRAPLVVICLSIVGQSLADLVFLSRTLENDPQVLSDISDTLWLPAYGLLALATVVPPLAFSRDPTADVPADVGVPRPKPVFSYGVIAAVVFVALAGPFLRGEATSVEILVVAVLLGGVILRLGALLTQNVSIDRTARRFYAAQLERRNQELSGNLEQLQRADRVRRDFIAMVSHELRTPLTSVSGYAATLADRGHELDSDTREEFLHGIRRNADRLGRLVDNLLVAAAAQSGRFDVVPNWLPAALLRDDLLEWARGALESDRLLVDGCWELDLWADRDRLGQVLRNLVENAVRATRGAGQVEVSVELVIDAASGGHVAMMRVRDHGPGIPAEVAEKLFSAPFTSGKSGGTGLGLFIARTIVEPHGGKIAVDTAVSDGACFVVTLPAARPGERPTAG